MCQDKGPLEYIFFALFGIHLVQVAIVKHLRPGSSGKGMGGFVGGSKFKSQWGQKLTIKKRVAIVKQTILGWHVPIVDKRRKKVWRAVALYIF